MRRLLCCSLLVLVAGCASRPQPVAVVAPPPPVVAVAPALPPGATPGMRIPAMLSDGSYPTPNRGLSPAATLWHLRAGLNVAALSCPGAQGDAIVAGYNAFLTGHKAELAAAETALAAEFHGSGAGDWRDAYDDAMTRLYNYFSQTPARPAFCAAATQVLAEATMQPVQTIAIAGMASLDRPFTDFYRAYDAWRAGTYMVAAPAMPTTVIATVAPVPTSVSAVSAPHPRLSIDPAIFTTP